VKRYLQIYKPVLFILIFFTASSCSTYAELNTSGRILLPVEDSGLKFYDSGNAVKSDSKPESNKNQVITMPKYLARGSGFNAQSIIMRKGVDEALSGNFIEAEILFNQVRENFTDGSVENNLAVIYELTKRKKEAHIMYTNALIKSPDNLKFRSNLLSFIKHNKFTR
jgi:hypothetical protein